MIILSTFVWVHKTFINNFFPPPMIIFHDLNGKLLKGNFIYYLFRNNHKKVWGKCCQWLCGWIIYIHMITPNPLRWNSISVYIHICKTKRLIPEYFSIIWTNSENWAFFGYCIWNFCSMINLIRVCWDQKDFWD